ncbi:MAG: Glycosyltransferase [Berkelbacteria bacterium GW2011_GWA2_35_9]|uniref:Glycosyltransferase n=1 Tax=Berkelbacteria bacterium GW2011_GWA2_35_9 TaxID=1618333 RepID=A0A0G0FJU5_9BACT|nr:MAG: Glycosyltransferase [Berkelbacteria bacterium GW2011_GWA2_35_9]
MILEISHSAGLMGGIEKQLTQIKNIFDQQYNLIFWVGNKKLADKLSGESIDWKLNINSGLTFLKYLLFQKREQKYFIKKLKELGSNLKVVHIHSLTEQLLITTIAKKLKLKVIWTIHGELDLGRNIWLKKIFATTARQVDQIICVTKNTQDQVKNYCPDANTAVVYNGVELPKHIYEKKFNLPITIGFVGRLSAEKNFSYFVQLIEGLWAKNIEVKIQIAGNKIDKQYDKFLANRRVKFCGYLENMDQFYNQIDWLIFPSPSEGCPYALLEAMANGVIPVVSLIKPLLEIIEDNCSGLVLSMKINSDIIKLVELLKNQTRMLNISVNAKKTATQYSSEIFSQNLTNIYEQN